jgi:hypothetical protein
MNASKSCAALALLLALSSPISISISADGSPTPTLDDEILVTQAAVPPGVAHTVLGPVQVRPRTGMGRAETLWPLLAVQAKAKGANAVVETQGGHRVSGFSWAAPYASGIAVKFEDPEKRKDLPGLWY